MSDDDVVSIGKLRRPGKPGAAVSYDPGYGIRIVGEDCPADADQAARWVKKSGGWMRVNARVKNALHPEVAYFVRAVRRHEVIR